MATPEITVITALNQELWREYASETVKTWPWQNLTVWWEERDQTEPWQCFRQHRQPEPDFEHTWRRFSHKVEAQCELSKRVKTRYMLWLDADVVYHSEPQWPDLIPQGEMITYLGRGENYHPETGWILYDLEHPRCREFVQALEQIYLTGRIFALGQWHDAAVWDHVCRELDVPRRDIGPKRPGEAFGRSPLKDLLLHLKGPRKSNIHTGTTREELMLKCKPIKE